MFEKVSLTRPGGHGDDLAITEEEKSCHRRRTHSLTAREQLRRTFLCFRRRRPPPPPSPPNAPSPPPSEAQLRADLNDDDSSDAATGHAGVHWPLHEPLLSASSHLLAVLTDSALILRSALTQYAFIDLVSHPIPPYFHSRSPYPSSQPSSHLFSSPLHPYSYSHSRPAAWYRDDLLAVAVRDDGVNVYDVDGVSLDNDGQPHSSIRLVHHFTLDRAQSPLEGSAGLGLLGRGGRKAFPTIAGMVWREARCHRTVSGVCPHLLVLTYDGGIHHVHLPTQPPPLAALSTPTLSASRLAFDARVGPHAPPTSTHSRSSSIITAPRSKAALAVDSSPSSLNAAIRKRFESHQRAASTAQTSSSPAGATERDDKRAEVITFDGVKQRHGNVADAEDGKAVDEEKEEEDEQLRAKDGGLQRRRKRRPVDISASASLSEGAADEEEAEPSVGVAFTGLAYEPLTQLLIVSSISLSPDRSPQLSIWRVRDQTSQHFSHVLSSPYIPPSLPPHPVQRHHSVMRAFHHLWKRVKITVGSSPSPSPADKAYEPTLSDVSSSLLLSPSGHRLLMLDMQGNMNVWQVDASSRDVRLIHTVRDYRRGEGGGTRGALLCQASWWAEDELVLGYTDGHLVLTSVSHHPSVSSASFSSPLPEAPASPPVNLLGQTEQVPGIPFLSPSIPAHTLTPPFPSIPPIPLPHRLFILSCHRRFLRKRRVWAHLDHPEEEAESLYEPEGIRMTAIFRLLSLSESTPGEFLHRKVELREWDDAMKMARLYHLDEDEVWKERWKAAEVGVESIHQLLAKVTDRWWILQQCATRGSEDSAKRRELLDYGLCLTSFRHLTAMAPSSSNSLFSSAMPDEGAVTERIDDAALQRLRLTADQARLCLYRLLFVQLMQRLDSFVILQQSSAAHHDSLYPLSSMAYTAFLTCDLASAAADLARDENFHALEALLHLHARELFLHRLHVLDEIPVTCDPSAYKDLLPLSTTLPPSAEERSRVWIFHPHLLNQLLEAESSFSQAPLSIEHVRGLIRQEEALASYRADVGAIVDWYLRRAQRMDVETGDLQQVASLCQLVAEKEPAVGRGLSDYLQALEDVRALVYGHDMDLTVAEWQRMDSLQRLKRLLADSREDSVVHDVLSKGAVVLQRSPSAASDADPLLLRFIRDAVSFDLHLVRGLVRAASSQLSALIPADDRLVDSVISALYTCPRHERESLEVIQDIVTALPDRTLTRLRRERLIRHVRADVVLEQYHTSQPLSFFHSLPDDAAPGVDAEGAEAKRAKDECLQLFHHLCRKAIRSKPAYTDWQWSELLTDVLNLRSLVFPFISLLDSYIGFMESLLAAGRFKLGKRMLRQLTGIDKREEQHKQQPKPSAAAESSRAKQSSHLAAVASTFGPSLQTSIEHFGLLSIPAAERLVLQVAREFLDSSASIDHPSLELARVCLHILPLQLSTDSLLPAFLASASSSSPSSSSSSSLSSADLTTQWQQELDFIEGLQQLSELQVSIIPYQLRTSASRLSFIPRLLQQYPAAYRDDDRVMDIARLFGCSSDEAQAEGRLLLLHAAMQARDVEVAYQMCLTLLENRRYKAAVGSALQVARMEGVKEERSMKRRLISNAVWACDVDQLDAVLAEWRTASIKPIDLDAFLQRWGAQQKQRRGSEEMRKVDAEEEVDSFPVEQAASMTQVERLIVDVLKPTSANPLDRFNAPSLLSYNFYHPSAEGSTLDALLLAQVEQTFITNPALALSYLLTTSAPLSVDEILETMLAGPLSRLSRAALVSLAFRYFALLTLSAHHSFLLPEQVDVVIGENPLLNVSDDLLQQLVDAIARRYQQQAELRRPDVLLRAVAYGELRADAKKAEQVLVQFPGLDLQKFTSDAVYRQSTILSLVHSPAADNVNVAQSLATRYGFSASAVYLERLKWLILSDTSLSDIKEEAQQWTTQLLMQPNDTYTVLTDDLFPRTNGRDLERVHFLVSLAERCFTAPESMAKTSSSSTRKAALDLSTRMARQLLTTHLQLLDRLMRAHLSLDYHQLIDREQVAGVVYEVVEEQNVALLERLADRLNEVVLAPHPLPPFPSLPASASPGSPTPTSPSRYPGQSLVTTSLISRQFLSKSLSSSLSSSSFSPSAWFNRHSPRFRQLSPLDACKLIAQGASVDGLQPPVTVDRLMLRLTLVDMGLDLLPSPLAKESPDLDVDRAHDELISLHERLSALVSITQLTSIASSPFFVQLLAGHSWRQIVGELMLKGDDAGVQVKEVKELVDILEDECAKHAHRYRQQPSVARQWTVESLAVELFEAEWARQVKVEAAALSSFQGRVPSVAVLASPAGLCSVYLDSAERCAGVHHLHALLTSYWTQALPAAVDDLDIALCLLVSLRALSTAAHSSLAPALRESLVARLHILDERIAHQRRLVLQQLPKSAESAAGDGEKFSPHQTDLVQRVRSLTHDLVAVPSHCFASLNGCALTAAAWEANSTPLSTNAWHALASLVSTHTSTHHARHSHTRRPSFHSWLLPFASLFVCVSAARLFGSFNVAAGCVAPLAESCAGRGAAALAVRRGGGVDELSDEDGRTYAGPVVALRLPPRGRRIRSPRAHQPAIQRRCGRGVAGLLLAHRPRHLRPTAPLYPLPLAVFKAYQHPRAAKQSCPCLLPCSSRRLLLHTPHAPLPHVRAGGAAAVPRAGRRVAGGAWLVADAVGGVPGGQRLPR